MKNWRAIASAIAAFSLAAAIIGCNADTAKEEDKYKPEPAVQDGGQQNDSDEDALSSGPQPEDDAVAGGGQGAEPSTDAGGNGGGNAGSAPGDQPVSTDPSEPQTADPAAGDEGGDDGLMTIMPVIEPSQEMEILPAVPEPTDGGPLPSGGGDSGQAGGIDPNTPVSKQNTP